MMNVAQTWRVAGSHHFPIHHSEKVPFGQVEELEGEILHLAARQAQTLDEVVIREERRNGCKESRGRVDERFADTRSYGSDRRRLHGADGGERLDDAPYRAEEADEGRRRRARGEERHEL